MKLKVTVNSVAYEVDVEVQEKQAAPLGAVVIGGGGAAPVVATSPSAGGGTASANAVPAPLAGTVLRFEVEEGQEVAAGDVLIILEAMKMETEITSPRAGKVTAILVDKGAAVQVGQGLIEVE
jgi:methylmalonyl-CoA carboxyltransferase small subunit